MAKNGEKGSKDPKKEKKEYRAEELLVVRETAPDANDRFSKVRVVKWTVGGVTNVPKLEKRGFYKGKKGDVLNGDHEVFTLEDVKALAEKMPQVLEAMQQGHF